MSAQRGQVPKISRVWLTSVKPCSLATWLDHLAVFSANAIEFSSDCHGLQGSIHSREAHAFTGRPEIGVDLLR